MARALLLALAALALVAPALAATRYEVLYLGNKNCTGVPDSIVSQPGKMACGVDWEVPCEALGKSGADTYAQYCLNETLPTSALVIPVYMLPTTVALTAEFASANCTGNITITSGNRVDHCISYAAGEDVDDTDGGSGMFMCDENDMPVVVQVGGVLLLGARARARIGSRVPTPHPRPAGRLLGAGGGRRGVGVEP